MSTLWYFLYNLVLSLWVGGISIFTFIITPVVFRSFERDMAGEIVGKLFPGYFLFTLLVSALALLLLLASGFHFEKAGYRLSLLLIAAAVIINLFVSFKLHPEARRVKQEIHSFDSATQESPLRKRFGQLHAISATLNLLILADGVALLFISTVFRKA